MAHEVVFVLGGDGMTVIAHANQLPGLQAAGLSSPNAVERIGRVEPDGAVKRAIFRLIRRIFPDGTRPYQWTRRWPGPWRVTIIRTGEVIGVFQNRDDAIHAEIEFALALEENHD